MSGGNNVQGKYIWLRKILGRWIRRILFSVVKQVRMYCGSGTGGRCCIRAGQTFRVHSPAAAAKSRAGLSGVQTSLRKLKKRCMFPSACAMKARF